MPLYFQDATMQHTYYINNKENSIVQCGKQWSVELSLLQFSLNLLWIWLDLVPDRVEASCLKLSFLFQALQKSQCYPPKPPCSCSRNILIFHRALATICPRVHLPKHPCIWMLPPIWSDLILQYFYITSQCFSKLNKSLIKCYDVFNVGYILLFIYFLQIMVTVTVWLWHISTGLRFSWILQG